MVTYRSKKRIMDELISACEKDSYTFPSQFSICPIDSGFFKSYIERQRFNNVKSAMTGLLCFLNRSAEQRLKAGKAKLKDFGIEVHRMPRRRRVVVVEEQLAAVNQNIPLENSNQPQMNRGGENQQSIPLITDAQPNVPQDQDNQMDIPPEVDPQPQNAQMHETERPRPDEIVPMIQQDGSQIQQQIVDSLNEFRMRFSETVVLQRPQPIIPQIQAAQPQLQPVDQVNENQNQVLISEGGRADAEPEIVDMPENIPIQLPQQPPSVVQPPEDPLIVIDDQQIPPVQLPHGNIEIPGNELVGNNASPVIEIPNVEPAVADRRVNLEPPENVEQEAQNENNANVARPRNVATGDRKRRRPRQKEAKNEATGLIEPHIRQINDHIIHMDIPIQQAQAPPVENPEVQPELQPQPQVEQLEPNLELDRQPEQPELNQPQPQEINDAIIVDVQEEQQEQNPSVIRAQATVEINIEDQNTNTMSGENQAAPSTDQSNTLQNQNSPFHVPAVHLLPISSTPINENQLERPFEMSDLQNQGLSIERPVTTSTIFIATSPFTSMPSTIAPITTTPSAGPMATSEPEVAVVQASATENAVDILRQRQRRPIDPAQYLNRRRLQYPHRPTFETYDIFEHLAATQEPRDLFDSILPVANTLPECQKFAGVLLERELVEIDELLTRDIGELAEAQRLQELYAIGEMASANVVRVITDDGKMSSLTFADFSEHSDDDEDDDDESISSSSDSSEDNSSNDSNNNTINSNDRNRSFDELENVSDDSGSDYRGEDEERSSGNEDMDGNGSVLSLNRDDLEADTVGSVIGNEEAEVEVAVTNDMDANLMEQSFESVSVFGDNRFSDLDQEGFGEEPFDEHENEVDMS